MVNTVTGAIEIQEAFEMREWGQQTGTNRRSPGCLTSRARPLAGSPSKMVAVYIFKGDQAAVESIRGRGTDQFRPAAEYPLLPA